MFIATTLFLLPWDLLMSTSFVLTVVSAVIMLIFTAVVLQRYFARHRLYMLFWGIGLAMFGLASLSEAILTRTWNQWIFYSWYLFGALLTAAWIGQGTVYLLVRKRRADILAAVLIAGSVFAAIALLRTVPDIDSSIFSTAESISEQYQEILPPIGEGGFVRLMTPFFNVYGLITLVGGAIYSSYLFWRKRILPNRVVGNILIAVGALIIAFAGLFTRSGYGVVLALGELLAAVLMFSGFLISAAPRPSAERPEKATTSVA